MATNSIVTRRGDMIDLGECLVGTNLNLLVLRGFAPLDVLADVSAPSIYDMVDNPTGTQRDLKPDHAQECFQYAMDAEALTPEDNPRMFPEIILNARDTNVFEFYDLDDTGELFDFTSVLGEAELDCPVFGVRIRATDLDFPKSASEPQISRVDGNHRLHQADITINETQEGDEELDYPIVAFTLLVGLSQIQEAHLFKDINGEHKGMDIAHLQQMTYSIGDPEELKLDPKTQPLWLATQLAMEGRAFEGMIFFGGSKVGVKKQTGGVPPIKINALKSTLAAQLKAAPVVAAHLKTDPEYLLELLDRFWKAVKETFPDAWQDKQGFILLQAIGLGAFAKFGGLTLDRAWDASALTQAQLKTYLAPVARSVSLIREDYPGIAGAGGQQYIADMLIGASDIDDVKTEQNRSTLKPEADHISKLDS